MKFWRWLLICGVVLPPCLAPQLLAAGHPAWFPSGWRGYITAQIQLPPTHQHSEVRLQMGDDPRWADPKWDDSTWQDVTRRGLPTRQGIFWIRYRVRGDAPLPAGISLKVCAAYELYWDGKLVGRSGRPAEVEEEERPGKLDSGFSIPGEWLAPDPQLLRKLRALRPGQRVSPAELAGAGEHVIAMRMSTYRCGFPGEWTDLQTTFVAPEERLAAFSQIAMEPTLAAGAMFMLAFISLIMWLIADRRPALLLFHGLCVCAAVTQALTMLRYVNSYTYDWHYPVRLFTVYLSAAVGLCLISFVCAHFAVPRRGWLLAVFILGFGAILGVPPEIFYRPLSEKSGLIMQVALVVALVGTAWAVWRRQPGAWAATIGTVLSAASGGNFTEHNFFPTFLPILVGLLCAVALRLREERGRAEEARLAAARLETELLKKNLQPHFFLNTLTALSEVVERDPRGAVSLIEDLAEEFRAMSRMSGETQVPLAQELELCRAHLRVMSVRTGVDWRLETNEVDDGMPVPPALFLTLIENAFVHQRPLGPAGTFTLRATPWADGVRFTFHSPGEIKPPRARGPGGTGMRYVRARLEESFGSRWELRHGPAGNGWETVIEVRDVRVHPGVTPAEVRP